MGIRLSTLVQDLNAFNNNLEDTGTAGTTGTANMLYS